MGSKDGNNIPSYSKEEIILKNNSEGKWVLEKKKKKEGKNDTRPECHGPRVEPGL